MRLIFIIVCALVNSINVVIGLQLQRSHTDQGSALTTPPAPQCWAEESISEEVKADRTHAISAANSTGAGNVFVPGMAAPGVQSERLTRYLKCNPRFASSSLRTVLSLHGTMVPHIFKDAGTALTRTVREYGGNVTSVFVQNITGEEVVEQFATHTGPRAAIVRNPVARAVSAFHEVMSRKHCEEDVSALADATDQEAMVQAFATDLQNSDDAHYHQQMQFLVDNKGHVIELDYIGSTDNLLQEVISIFGLPDDAYIPDRSGPKCGQKHKDVYRIDITRLPPHVIRTACEKYAVDYCCLGFEFPPECASISCEDWLS